MKSREEKKSHNDIIFDISLHLFIYSVFPYVNDLQDASPTPPHYFFRAVVSNLNQVCLIRGTSKMSLGLGLL